MNQNSLRERFFDALIQGNRSTARNIVEHCLKCSVPPHEVIEKLFWPVYEDVQKMYRKDQLSEACHQYATRLLRMLTHQMQMRLDVRERNDRRVLLIGGPTEGDEIAAQMSGDLLEADGYEVYFVGGGVANDEVVDQVGRLRPNVLVLFGNAPGDLPHIRLLIEQLHELGACPDMQVAVGGGVFSRTDGLADEVGADLYAHTPLELVEAISQCPEKRMHEDQRTVGRKGRVVSAA